MEYRIRPYQKGEEQYVADAHRRVYAQEYRWGDAFISYAAKVAVDFAHQEPEAGECLWVAEDVSCNKLIGCIMLCNTQQQNVGQLRLFLVEQAYRGCGVGSALTNTLLAEAKRAGYGKLVLWTASPLTDAIRHYQHLGFRTVESVDNTTWSTCGETLQEIKMELRL